MIDDSDFCVFYYDKNYKPPIQKRSKTSISYYQPNSGTALAYAYAKYKKTTIVNIFYDDSCNMLLFDEVKTK